MAGRPFFIIFAGSKAALRGSGDHEDTIEPLHGSDGGVGEGQGGRGGEEVGGNGVPGVIGEVVFVLDAVGLARDGGPGEDDATGDEGYGLDLGRGDDVEDGIAARDRTEGVGNYDAIGAGIGKHQVADNERGGG